MKRLVAAACVLLALTGCFGRDGAAPEASGSHSPTPPGRNGVEGQRVVFAVGAEVAQAGLIQTCDFENVCTRAPRSASGRLTVDEPRPVLSVAFEFTPDLVEGVVRRDGRRGEPQELRPGTLVAWRPLVQPGRSELRIVATYGAVRWEWGIDVVRRDGA